MLRRRKLQLGSVCLSIPHPQKAGNGGDDACFSTKHAIGVFDGVGGWHDVGVDPARFTRRLARLVKCEISRMNTIHPKKAVQISLAKNKRRGSCTACVMSLQGGILRGVNVGDSGFILIRGERVVHETKSMRTAFNSPLQISHDRTIDIDRASSMRVRVKEGDILVFATDGLWDNVFTEKVTTSVRQHHRRVAIRESVRVGRCPEPSPRDIRKQFPATPRFQDFVRHSSTNEVPDTGNKLNYTAESLREVAFELGYRACRAASSKSKVTPFAISARKENVPHRGGKMDDISIVVALVSSEKSSEISTSILADYPTFE